MAAQVSRRLAQPPRLLLTALLVLWSAHAAIGKDVIHVGVVAARQMLHSWFPLCCSNLSIHSHHALVLCHDNLPSLLFPSLSPSLAAAVAPAGAATVAGTQVKCQISSKGHSVLHGQQPSTGTTQYWDRTPSALKAGLIREISVYYDSKQECIAGIKLTYGTKPGSVSHLMGRERGPGFYEKLLMLDEKEHINRVDVGYNSK
jgi:hypothetical protein